MFLLPFIVMWYYVCCCDMWLYVRISRQNIRGVQQHFRPVFRYEGSTYTVFHTYVLIKVVSLLTLPMHTDSLSGNRTWIFSTTLGHKGSASQPHSYFPKTGFNIIFHPPVSLPSDHFLRSFLGHFLFEFFVSTIWVPYRVQFNLICVFILESDS